MSQRDSGYERKERDLYETPAWVTEALLPHVSIFAGDEVWEPACGSGKMVAVLKKHGLNVWESDIETGADFLTVPMSPDRRVNAIITNPPYELATEFIDRALGHMRHSEGTVAMLLRTDFDHAKTRARLFADCAEFAKKVVLTKRIKWFEDSKGQPSFNHAWFIWDYTHRGAPTLAYGPPTPRVLGREQASD
jgi:hypothetical protein